MGRCPPLGGEPGDGAPPLAPGRRGSDVAAGGGGAPGAGVRPRGAVVSLVPPMGIVVWTLHPAGAVRGPDELPALEAPEDAGRAGELARAIVSSATELGHDTCIDPIEARLEAAIEARLSGRGPGVGQAIAGGTKG